MNILIITKEYNPSTGADSKRFTGISKYFAEQGHQVTVICDTENPTPIHENISVIGVKKVGRDSYGMFERLISHSAFMFQAILKGRKLNGVDVVIATSPPAFNMIAGRKLSKKLQAKYVVDLRDIWPEVFEQTEVLTSSSIIYKVFNIIAKKSYKHADLISVVTPGKKEMLIKKYPEYKRKIHFLSNGFNKEILDNEIDEKFSKNFEGYINVVYTGKIGMAQDLTQLVELASDYKHIENLKFHLLGHGNSIDELKNVIFEKELKNIEFYGYRNEKEVTTAIRKSHIAYVSLGNDKLIDSIPTKIYEAMVFGCPILLSAKGDAVDLINEFDYGIASLPKDYKKLKNNFKQLVDNNDKYKEKKYEVRKKLMDKYSRDVVSEEYLLLINTLFNEKTIY